MKVILFGATGMIGQGALLECLRDPDVSAVLSVIRKPTGRVHPKLKEIEHADFTDYADINEQFRNYDACFFCLGVSSVGMSETDYRTITHDYTLAAARAFFAVNPKGTFVYISAEGADSSECGRIMWARVRGKTENDLLQLGGNAYSIRPALIQPMDGVQARQAWVRRFYKAAAPLTPMLKKLFPFYVTDTQRLGRTMLKLAKRGYDNRILVSRDINKLGAALSLLLFTAATAFAQTPTVIHAARMLDVVSGKMINDAHVVVTGKTITAVNPTSLPAGAKTIELGDVTLLPGFIDMHTHLNGEPITPQNVHDDVIETPQDEAMHAVKNGRITLNAGFTTVRDLGSPAVLALGNAVERGDVVGPHVFSSRVAIGITGGHCDVTGYAPGVKEIGYQDGVADGVDEFVKSVRYQIKHGATVIKICATAGVLSMEGPIGTQQMSDAELKAVVDEATLHGLKVAAHAHGTQGIKAAVRAGVASIEHGSMLDDEAIRMMKERGTYLVPTSYLADRIDRNALPPVMRRKADEVLPLARESLRKAIAAGVKIAFGTDAAVYPHGENAHEFAVYVKQGMSPLDALRTATINAVDLLGRDDRGVIAPGKLADLVAVPGNPLEDITVTQRVSWVMFDGKVVNRDGN